MKEEYEIIFWKEWLEADALKRRKLVKNLLIIKEALQIEKFPKEHREQLLANSLNSYFEDLESAMYTKIRLERKKK